MTNAAYHALAARRPGANAIKWLERAYHHAERGEYVTAFRAWQVAVECEAQYLEHALLADFELDTLR